MHLDPALDRLKALIAAHEDFAERLCNAVANLPASDIYLARRLEQLWALTESVTPTWKTRCLLASSRDRLRRHRCLHPCRLGM
jgi:hypothetical protein